MDRRFVWRSRPERWPRIDAPVGQDQDLGAEIRAEKGTDRVTGVDYEVEYNNRARVPENPALMAGWARDAAAYREQRAPRRIAYGPGQRQVIDVFAGKGREKDSAPLVVFIHGGDLQGVGGG